MNTNDCGFNNGLNDPCASAPPPVAVCLRKKAEHTAACTVKAWRVAKCTSGVLTLEYQTNVNELPSGTTLAGAYGDYVEGACAPCSSPPPPAPLPTVTVNALNCDQTTAPVVVNQVVQTFPAPNAVQLVKLCPDPLKAKDREMVVLCAPTGEKVAVQNVTDENAPLGTAPAFEFWALTGGNWVGDQTTLRDCATEKIDVAAPVLVCKAGIEYTRTDFWNIDVTPKTLAGSIWQDALGAVVAPPAAPFMVGKCDRAVVNVDRDICANMKSGDIWDVVERTITSASGAVTTKYFDGDTSPMVEITGQFYAIRHSGKCNCCLDVIPPKKASLTLTKKALQPNVFDGDNLSFEIMVQNLGPDAADGAVIQDSLPGNWVPTGSAVITTTGGAVASGSAPAFVVTTFPANSTVTIVMTGTVTGGTAVENSATITPPDGYVDDPLGDNSDTAIVPVCHWDTFHEVLIPASTLMGVYGNATSQPNLGFINYSTGVLTNVGTVPGARLNALGLDKSSNNAVMLDRNTGTIYTAYSPGYAITAASTLGSGSILAANAIMGALDSTQTYWVGGVVVGAGAATATVNVAKVDPLTGVQTAIPSLTATLTAGGNGYDFDFAPNDDLYAVVGMNLYLSTKASNYSGWINIGAVGGGIVNTAGSLAYDQGKLRGTSQAAQVWEFDIAAGATAVTSSLAAGTIMSDMSGAVDPVCKRFYRNSCTGQYFELNKVVPYAPSGTPIAGGC